MYAPWLCIYLFPSWYISCVCYALVSHIMLQYIHQFTEGYLYAIIILFRYHIKFRGDLFNKRLNWTLGVACRMYRPDILGSWGGWLGHVRGMVCSGHFLSCALELNCLHICVPNEAGMKGELSVDWDCKMCTLVRCDEWQVVNLIEGSYPTLIRVCERFALFHLATVNWL